MFVPFVCHQLKQIFFSSVVLFCVCCLLYHCCVLFLLASCTSEEKKQLFSSSSSSSFDLACMYVYAPRERERKNCLSVYVFDLSCSCVCVFTIAHSVSSVIYIARDEKKKYSNKNEKKASSSVLWDPLSLCQGETGSVPGYFLIGGSFALGSGRVGERWPRIAFIGTGTLRRCGGWR